jgi:hypothetical protein
VDNDIGHRALDVFGELYKPRLLDEKAAAFFIFDLLCILLDSYGSGTIIQLMAMEDIFSKPVSILPEADPTNIEAISIEAQTMQLAAVVLQEVQDAAAAGGYVDLIMVRQALEQRYIIPNGMSVERLLPDAIGLLGQLGNAKALEAESLRAAPVADMSVRGEQLQPHLQDTPHRGRARRIGRGLRLVLHH